MVSRIPALNGVVGFTAEKDVSPYVESALRAMAHRACQGYVVRSPSKEVKRGLNAVRLPSRALVAGCMGRGPVGEEVGGVFHGVVYEPPSPAPLNRALALMAEGDAEGAAGVLASLDGAYAAAALCGEDLFCARDPLGLRPLYMGRGEGAVGVASEAKALRAAGLRSTASLAPGYVYRLTPDSEERCQIASIKTGLLFEGDLDEAAERVLSLLTESVARRVRGVDRVVVGFSGGLDSSLLAVLASRLCGVRLLSVYAPGSRDEREAEGAARLLHLDFEGVRVSSEDLAEVLSRLPALIESESPMDVGIAAAVHLSARWACENGYDCLVLGQLADELFGGYARYMGLLKEAGEGAAAEVMRHDVLDAYRMNFERDERASSPYVPLTLPYAYLSLVEFALGLPVKYKLDIGEGVRKVVLRRAALRAGVPEEVALMPKKAVQHSSGLHGMVEKLRGRIRL